MSGDPQFVDVTYRGLKVASRAKLVPQDGGWFVEHEAPLPVGTRVLVADRDGGPPRDARVIAVVEQEAGARSAPGMRIQFADEITAPMPQVAEAEASVPEPADSTRQTTVLEVPVVEDPSGDDRSSPGDVERGAPEEGGAPGGRRGKKRRKPNGR